eukprot:3245334-Pyramimonas_sp.AAC.1
MSDLNDEWADAPPARLARPPPQPLSPAPTAVSALAEQLAEILESREGMLLMLRDRSSNLAADERRWALLDDDGLRRVLLQALGLQRPAESASAPRGESA